MKKRRLGARILSGILTAAMLFTMAPTTLTSLAAEAEPAEEVNVVEEVAPAEEAEAPAGDVVEDASEAEATAAEEETGEAVETAASAEEGAGAMLEEEEEADQFDSEKDVNIWFVKSAPDTGHIYLYPDGIASNYTTSDALAETDSDRKNYYNTVLTVNGSKEITSQTGGSVSAVVGTKDYGTPTLVAADTTKDTIETTADSDNPFVFYMEPEVGYTWLPQTANKTALEIVKGLLDVRYTNFNESEHALTTDYATMFGNTRLDKAETETASASDVTVEDVSWNDNLKKVTISASLLKKVIAASKTATTESSSATTYKYEKAVLAIHIGSLDDTENVAYKALPEFDYGTDTGTQLLTSARTFTWTTGTPATTVAHIKTLTIPATTTIAGKTLSNTMFSLLYTPADGSDQIKYTVGSAGGTLDADPENSTITSRGAVGGTYNASTGDLSISARLINAFIKGAGDLKLVVNASSYVSKIYNVTTKVDSTYAKITGSDGQALPATIDASKSTYSFTVTPEQGENGTRTVSKIEVKTNTEGVVVCSLEGSDLDTGNHTTYVVGTDSSTGAKTITLRETLLGKVNDAITITAATCEEVKSSLTSVTLYNAKGKPLSSADAVSGKKMVFEARPAGGMEIESVQYYFGVNGARQTPTKEETDGLYSIPAVTGTVTIVASAKAASAKVSVRAVSGGDTFIHSVFEGSAANFNTYWNGIYGAGSAPTDAGSGNVIAMTIAVGNDWPDDATHWGVYAKNTTKNDKDTWTYNVIEASKRFANANATNGYYLVTLYDNDTVLKKTNGNGLNWSSGDTISFQAFAVNDGDANHNISDDTAKSKAVMLGKPFSTPLTENGGTAGKVTNSAGEWTSIVYRGEVSTNVTASKFTFNKEVADEAAVGQPYFFTVYPGSDKEIKTVQYRMGRTRFTASALTDATLVSKTNGYSVYKTAPVTNNVYIYVASSGSATLYAPDNKKVTVNFAKTGESVTIPSDNDLYFTVTPAANVTVKKVYWASSNNLDTNSLTVLGDGEYKYKIPATSISNGAKIYIGVETEEAVPSSTYDVTWAVAGESEITKYPVLSQTAGSQALSLTVGETTAANGGTGYLTATFKKKDIAHTTAGTVNTRATTPKAEEEGFYVASYKFGGTENTENIVTADSTSSQCLITANKVGTDKISAKLIAADTENSAAYDFNKLVYTAELPVTVTAPYKDVKIIATSDAIAGTGATSTKPARYTEAKEITAVKAAKGGANIPATGEMAYFTIVGVDSRTNEKVILTDELQGVQIQGWSFYPPTGDAAVKTKKLTGGAGNYNYDNTGTTNPNTWVDEITGGTDTSNADAWEVNKILVTGTEDQSNVRVAANLQQAGETTPTPVISDPIKIVESGFYGIYPKIEITNGKAEEGRTSIPQAGNSTAYTLEKSGSMTGAKVDVALYENESTTFASELSNATTLATAVNSGVLEKVSGSVVYETAFNDKNTAADKSSYLSVSGSNGSYQVKVENAPSTGKIQGIELTISAKVDDVVVDTQVFKFDVENALPKKTVYLKLNDVETKTNNDVVQQKLTDTFYAGRAHSIVTTNASVTVTSDNEGVKFTALTEGSTFKLPVQTDFDSTLIGKGRTLIAWDSGSKYFYPGETFTVAGAEEFSAVWLDKYEWKDNAASNAIKGKGLKVYNGNVPIKTDEVITGYDNFAYGSDAATPLLTAGSINKGGSIPVMLWFKENAALTKETAAKVTYSHGIRSTDTTKKTVVAAMQTDKFVSGSGVSITSNAVDWKDVVTVSNGVITGKTKTAAEQKFSVSWEAETGVTYSTIDLSLSVLDAPGYVLTLDGGNKQFMVGQANAYIGADLKTTEPSALIGNANYSSYKYVWTSSDTSVAEIEASQKGAADAATKSGYGKLTLKKAGSTNIGLTVTDASGIPVSATALTITVKDSGLTVKLLDPEGKETDRIYAETQYAANTTPKFTDATKYTLSFSSLTGLSITSNAVDADGKYVSASGSTIDGTTNAITIATINQGDTTNVYWTDAKNAEKRGLTDAGWVSLGYTYNGTQFEKKIPVSTYYTITLDKVSLTANSVNQKIAITKNGTVVVAKDKNTSTDVVKIKVTATNQKLSGDGSATNQYVRTYENISLAEYGATYDDDADPHELIGWNTTGGVSTTPIYTSTEGIAKLTEAALYGGTYTLKPVFDSTAITKATLTRNVITLNNEIGKSATIGTDNESVKISVTVEPYATKAVLELVPDKVNFYGMAVASDPHATAFVAESLDLGYISPVNKIQTRSFFISAAKSGKVNENTIANDANNIFTRGRRAGTATIKIMSGDNQLGTLTLNVNGYDTKEDVYYEDGEIVKNAGRSVIGETWYFGPDGKRISKDGMLELADGSIILIINGAVATEGLHDYTDESGKSATYVVDKNGKILTGWITKNYTATTNPSDGVYYADPDNKGALVMNATKAAGGRTYYFAADGKKATASASANEYEQVGTTAYYVNAAGEVAVNGIFKVNGKDRAFRADYTIVNGNAADLTNGKIQLNGVWYVIDPSTGEATLDEVILVSKAPTDSDWTWTPLSTKDQTPVATVKITYKGEVGKTHEEPYTVEYSSATGAVSLSRTETTVGRNTKVTWTASVTAEYPVNQGDPNPVYTDDAVYTFDPDGNIIKGGENSSATVEGLSYTIPTKTFTYTGKAITLDDLKLYWTNADGETNLLVLNTDYSLKYTSNVNVGTATVTVTGKGDYAGVDATDISFAIEPKDISGLDFTADDVVIKNTAKVKNPVLKWGTKSLKYGTDYEVDYASLDGISFNEKPTADAGAYTAMITGKGNYTGEKYFYLYIVDSSTVDAKAVQVVIPQAAKNMLKVDPKTGFDYTAFLELIQVKYKGTVLDRDDYSISITGEPSVGKKNIKVSFDGTNSSKLLGTKYQAITITGEKLVANNFSAITGKQTVPFKGEAWTWEDVVSELNLDTDKLGNGQAYTVALSNNVKSGTMKVTFTGDAFSWYQGSVSKNIKIGKVQKYSVSINGVDIGTTVDDKVTTGMTTDTEVPMLPGGATIQNLEIRALGDDVLLREKTDYTISYKNNKTVGGTATVTINGKGNYGKAIFQFVVGKGVISEDTLYINTKDVKYNSNKTTWAKYVNENQMPALTDLTTGKKLTKNDFTWEYVYPTEAFAWDEDGVWVEAKITGKGNYTGEITIPAVHIYSDDLKANMFTPPIKTYTGSPITFEESELKFSGGDSNIQILSFINNIKKGTGKVVVRGLGKYGKTLTLSFKINAASLGTATK